MITQKYYSPKTETSLEAFVNSSNRIVLDLQECDPHDPFFPGLIIDLSPDEVKHLINNLKFLLKEVGE